MKLSYFSYDFWECCCEAVNAGVCVAPRVFRAPEGPAAREARRPHFVRRRASKPARALRSLRRPPHLWGLRCCVVSARPRHRPRAPQPDPPVRTAPSTPVGPGVLMRIHIIAEPTPNIACNSPTTASSFEFRSLELQRFHASLKLHPIKLHATFLGSAPDTTTGTSANTLTRHRPHKREKVRPAPAKLPKIGQFELAGRVSSRPYPESRHSGRVFRANGSHSYLKITRQPPRLKPMTPMRVDHCHEMKPLTPLLARNSQFQAIFRPQRCHGFHVPLAEHPQKRRRFHQPSYQGCWLTAKCSDAHACCLRHTPGSVGA